MRTNGSVYIKGRTVVFCEGGDINSQTRCSRFMVQNKVFDAIESSVRNSISDIPQLALVLQGKVDVPDGEMIILE